jgi:hypothetical protein
MGLALLASFLSNELLVEFATGALVTGIALLATGFTQGQRQEIAYYQLAIIVQMSGMGFGPAALAWLKRGHGRPDTVFFSFTVFYVIIMACYLFYVVARQNGLDCFNPPSFGKQYLKILNAVVLSVSIALILLSVGINRFINRRYYNGSNDYDRRPPIPRVLVLIITLLILAATTLLAISVERTITEYSQFVPADQVVEANAWGFGQIIPFMMLLQPVMETIKTYFPRIAFRRNADVTVVEETVESGKQG